MRVNYILFVYIFELDNNIRGLQTLRFYSLS